MPADTEFTKCICLTHLLHGGPNDWCVLEEIGWDYKWKWQTYPHLAGLFIEVQYRSHVQTLRIIFFFLEEGRTHIWWRVLSSYFKHGCNPQQQMGRKYNVCSWHRCCLVPLGYKEFFSTKWRCELNEDLGHTKMIACINHFTFSQHISQSKSVDSRAYFFWLWLKRTNSWMTKQEKLAECVFNVISVRKRVPHPRTEHQRSDSKWETSIPAGSLPIHVIMLLSHTCCLPGSLLTNKDMSKL